MTNISVTESGEGFFTLGLRNSVRVETNSLLEKTRSAVVHRLSGLGAPSDSPGVCACGVHVRIATHLDTLDTVELNFSDSRHALNKFQAYKERSFRKNSFVAFVRSNFTRYLSIRTLVMLYNLSSRLKRLKFPK